ncbi:hypothetical protein ACLKA6_007306 [Drosophila palustris]
MPSTLTDAPNVILHSTRSTMRLSCDDNIRKTGQAAPSTPRKHDNGSFVSVNSNDSQRLSETESSKWQKVGQRSKQTKKHNCRPDAVMIRCKEKDSYVQVLKVVHSEAATQEFKNKVSGIRRIELLTVSRRHAKRQWRNGIVKEADEIRFRGGMIVFRIQPNGVKDQAITESKKRCFQELCAAADAEPFGAAYKMVMGKLNKQPMPTCETTLDTIVRHLFLQQPPLCALVHLPGYTIASEVMDIADYGKYQRTQTAKQEAHSRSSQLNPAVRFQNLGSSDERAYVDVEEPSRQLSLPLQGGSQKAEQPKAKDEFEWQLVPYIPFFPELSSQRRTFCSGINPSTSQANFGELNFDDSSCSLSSTMEFEPI